MLTSDSNWLDSLISSHRKKLDDIRQWQLNYSDNTYQQQINQSQSQSQSLPNTNNQIDQSNTNEELSSDINQLTKKVARQRVKIKSLKTSLNLLSEENASLKGQLIHLDNYTQSLTIDQKKQHFNQTNHKEESLLLELAHLQETIHTLEVKIDKMQRIDNIKTQDIELLNQKVKDLEIIAEESTINANYDIDKLTKENEVYKNQLNEVDKLFELFNYFVKRMSALYPNDMLKEQIPYLNIKEYQTKLIQIENCIVNDKNRMTCQLKGLDDKYYQTMIKSNKTIDQLVQENNELKVKLNETENAIAKVKAKRSSSSDQLKKIKNKKTNRVTSKAKNKK